MNPLDSLYQQLLKFSMQETRKTKKAADYSKLYYSVVIPFKDDRILNIRYVKLPTFTRERKQHYYAVFLNDIEFWRAGEKQEIYKQVIETIDRYDVDSYTIFQFGTYHGHVDPLVNHLMKYYHIYVFNKAQAQEKDEGTIYRFISDFLQKRVDARNKSDVIFGEVLDDIKRLQNFASLLNEVLELKVVVK